MSNGPSEQKPQIWLDPDDPIERILIDVAKTNRKKRADYASDENPFLNFDRVAAKRGCTALEVVEFMLDIKECRIDNLRGREAVNESVVDTYLDVAVYRILAYGLALRDGV